MLSDCASIAAMDSQKWHLVLFAQCYSYCRSEEFLDVRNPDLSKVSPWKLGTSSVSFRPYHQKSNAQRPHKYDCSRVLSVRNLGPVFQRIKEKSQILHHLYFANFQSASQSADLTKFS